MDRDNPREPIVDFPPASLKRVSWSAVFAGVVVALVVQLAFTLLGIGIGAATISPLEEADPTRGLSIGSAIWFALTTILALFSGGWVAGRLAGVPRRAESTLHGVVTWGVTTLAMFWMLGTTVGALISGTAAVVGHGVEAAAQVGQAAVQRADRRQERQEDRQAGAAESLRQRAQELMRQAPTPETRPESLHNRAKEAVQRSSNPQTAQDPRYSDQALEQVLDRIDESGTQGSHPSDRDDLLGILVARTGMSRQEAEARMAEWERDNQQVMRDYEVARARVEEEVREAGQKAATVVSTAAIATFVMLLLGFIAAAFGGATGTPKDIAYGVARA